MRTTVKRFWEDESGPELVEWALVTVILLIATTAVVISLREVIVDTLKSLFAALQEDPDDAWTSGGAVGPAPAPTVGP